MKTRIHNITIYDGKKNILENTSVIFDENGILEIGTECDADTDRKSVV